jgi:hypothetical protein
MLIDMKLPTTPLANYFLCGELQTPFVVNNNTLQGKIINNALQAEYIHNPTKTYSLDRYPIKSIIQVPENKYIRGSYYIQPATIECINSAIHQIIQTEMLAFSTALLSLGVSLEETIIKYQDTFGYPVDFYTRDAILKSIYRNITLKNKKLNNNKTLYDNVR